MSAEETATLRRELARLYAGAPLFTRLLATLRPFICPFEVVLREVPANARALDIGCGSGIVLNLLAARGQLAQGTGLDLNRAAIKAAQAVAQRQGAGALAFHAVAAGDALPSGPYEAVLMVDVLHHVPPPMQKGLFLEAAARLVPGGRLVYKDMAERPLWCALANRAHDLLLARQLIHYVPLAAARDWAREAGLREVASGARRCFAYAHEWLVLEKAA